MTETTAPVATGTKARLRGPPSEFFFMSFRDVGLWVRSARTDAAVARDVAAGGVAHAFEARYRADPDPFGAADPRYRYQARKYAMLMSFLPARRYRTALELGCGNGAMCRALAPYAETITGVDVAESALAHARLLSRNHPNVTFARGDIGTFDAAERRYDLIVIADVVYYALPREDPAALADIASRTAAALSPGGILLLADHYFCRIDSASRRTRAIHDAFRQTRGVKLLAQHRRCFYLATVLERAA